MNFSSPKLWIAFVSLVAVAFLAVIDFSRTSPGPLAAVHAREEDLAGRSCAACHGGWLSTMTESCLECHALVAEQMGAREGLHGSLPEAKAQRCALCHSEHHGAGFAIVNRQSFVLAGSANPEKFDHQMVGFLMDGKHLELACTECHENAEVKELAKGTTRFIGLDRDCASCHEDVHEGQMALACTSCHGQETWDGLHSLGHEEHLPLVGGHGDVTCRTCHAEAEPHSLEVLGSSASRPRARECVDCHASPHVPDFVERTLALGNTAEAADAASAPDTNVGATFGASCVACHRAEHATFADSAGLLTAAQHACSGFPLDVPHHEVECQACHAPDAGDFVARYPGRGPEQCSRCHADVHEGQFVLGPFKGGECTTCHAREHFEPHTFGVEQHALTSLELTGRHLEIACEDCHFVEEAESPRLFHGTPSDCEACHGDPHGEFFDDFTADLDAIEHGECARCHQTQSFAELPADGFDHEAWTEFPIHGAHAQSDCESCHPLAAEPDEFGRRFGRVAEVFGAFEGCVTCHDDPHRGVFDRPGLPSEINGRADCARCHDETSFRAFERDFEHGQWTGFYLVGAHGRAECSACHEPMTAPDPLGRTWGFAAGPGCADCHYDAHAGQFKVEGATDCSRCHTSRVASYLSFDHERDSRFALGEAHSTLECADCHQTYALAGGASVVRYRPLGIDCVDCHGVQEGGFLRRKLRTK